MNRMADERTHMEQDVSLTPFEHQVPGKSVILKICNKLICKQREQPELEFYKAMPQNLRHFVPEFKGEIMVKCCKKENDFVLLARIPSELKDSVDENEVRKRYYNEDLAALSKRCLKNAVHNKILWVDNIFEPFIVLENLTADYKKPSMLDIKLGRKQRGAYSSCKKQRTKMQDISISTTSGSLGLRIQGMQQHSKGEDNCEECTLMNKEDGRSLSKEDAVRKIKHFFFGLQERKNEFVYIRERLQSIYRALSERDEFLFFSMSLLFIYETDQSDDAYDDKQPYKADVRIIDFQKMTSRHSDDYIPLYDECYEGILFGISNMVKILDECFREL